MSRKVILFTGCDAKHEYTMDDGPVPAEFVIAMQPYPRRWFSEAKPKVESNYRKRVFLLESVNEKTGVCIYRERVE